MNNPERADDDENPEDGGIDLELVRAEREAMMWGVHGEAPANRPKSVKPGNIVVQFESFHDDE